MSELDFSKLHPETVAVHAGRAVDPATGAVAAPIHLSTTFERATDGTFPSGFDYGRSNNPNRAALERGLALLEGGQVAAAFASGSAASSAIFQALSPGDHVIAPLSTSLWPPKYFVVECMTRSAPRARGRWMSGAQVLSQATNAPCRCAISAIAARSVSLRVGLEGVSAQMSLVAGRSAIFTAAGSVISTKSMANFQRVKMLRKRRKMP
jgi:hypothetical protein